MPIEVLAVIAQLCLLSNGSTHKFDNEFLQLQCQKYYVECLWQRKANDNFGYHIAQCLMVKK